MLLSGSSSSHVREVEVTKGKQPQVPELRDELRDSGSSQLKSKGGADKSLRDEPLLLHCQNVILVSFGCSYE